jgi:zinc/manganese transport system substrate-binding protein
MLSRSCLALAAASSLVLSACMSPAAVPADTVSVVASTNVYGDIVRQISGDKATITSLITDPGADPHLYEADARTQLELAKAQVVVENGGGYDDFVDTMLRAANNPGVRVVNVVDVSGRIAPAGGELNEHVWYDFTTVSMLTDELARTLGAVDPANASTFTANADTFKERLQRLSAAAAAIRSVHSGDGVAITEAVPLYLLDACGLENKTPEEFSQAIEEDSDPPVGVLQETLDLFADKRVKLLVYNAQTGGPETDRVKAAAAANGVPVVAVTETLPAGKDYLTWMSDNLSAIRSALG